ncbi:MAG TPA: metallophosphoesterase family protein [Ktedonobacteraceae bacterium]|nr:metallophosphoesterase family protein [Ktedonobacteraceae bacterium]
MRLAVISDMHGNAIALDAVLAEIKTEGIDHIVCLGDVAATGPQPRQVIERLKALGCLVVMGNTDAWLLSPEIKETGDEFSRKIEDIDLWCAQQLSAGDKAYLQTFQPTITYALERSKSLLGYHGSPLSFHEQILPITPQEDLDQAFAGCHANILAGGHTHLQMFRRYRDMLIINPGSVGLAYDPVYPLDEARNPPWAEYAVVNVTEGKLSVELRRTPFDVRTFAETIVESGMPHAEWLAKDWG